MASSILESSFKFIKSRSVQIKRIKLPQIAEERAIGISNTEKKLVEQVLKPRAYTLKKDNSKYLYHLTSQSCYEMILKSGGLKPKKGIDTVGIPQLFLFNLENLLNAWSKNESKSYLSKLLFKFLKNDDKLVMLRIKTKDLDSNKLKIRPLGSLFSIIKKDDLINPMLKGKNS